MSCDFSFGTIDATFCHVSVPAPFKIFVAGTPWDSRYVAETSASV